MVEVCCRMLDVDVEVLMVRSLNSIEDPTCENMHGCVQVPFLCSGLLGEGAQEHAFGELEDFDITSANAFSRWT
jgi:hypothetical protein